MLATALALAQPAPALAGDELTVFAAASLTDVAEALGAAFAPRAQGRVRVVSAASSTLAKQIDQGAPAGIFLSADRAWADWLVARGRLAADSLVEFAGNALLVVIPRDRTVAALAPLDLLASIGPGRIAVGDAEHVPVGRYARQVLEREGLWAAISPALVPAANTRDALRLVETSQVAAGIVYATDARAGRVTIVGSLPDPDPPISYVAGRVVAGKIDMRAEADAFLAFLGGEEARELLCARGFRPRAESHC